MLIAEALVRISILMIKDWRETKVFAVDCRGISQNIHFHVKRLWREDKCFCC